MYKKSGGEHKKMKRYSRVCAKIDLDAIAYNMEQMKNRIGEDARLIAVIKTDGYGHGAVPIAGCLRMYPMSGDMPSHASERESF